MQGRSGNRSLWSGELIFFLQAMFLVAPRSLSRRGLQGRRAVLGACNRIWRDRPDRGGSGDISCACRNPGSAIGSGSISGDKASQQVEGPFFLIGSPGHLPPLFLRRIPRDSQGSPRTVLFPWNACQVTEEHDDNHPAEERSSAFFLFPWQETSRKGILR